MRDEGDRTVQYFRCGGRIGNLLRILLLECVVLRLEIFREHRHRCGRHMEGAERPSQGLQRCYDFCILPVAATLEVTEDHHFNEIEQGYGFFTAQLRQLAIELAADRHELYSQSFLLVVTPGFKIDAVSRASDPHNSVFAATLAADQSS